MPKPGALIIDDELAVREAKDQSSSKATIYRRAKLAAVNLKTRYSGTAAKCSIARAT